MAAFFAKIVGLRELRVKLGRLAQSITNKEAMLNRIGLYLRARILKHTAQGVDVDGNPFVPYSTSYKEVRESAGLPVDKVDLFFTGSMLSALATETAPNKVSLFFMNTTDKFGMRNPEKAYYNQNIRDFFSISAKDATAINKMVKKYIAEQMR